MGAFSSGYLAPPPEAPLGHLYRYVELVYGTDWDDFEEKWINDRMRLVRDSYRIAKVTRCGVWIDLNYGVRKFVLLTATKKWACKTPKEALYSFIKRKERQMWLAEAKLSRAKEAHELGLKLQAENEKKENADESQREV